MNIFAEVTTTCPQRETHKAAENATTDTSKKDTKRDMCLCTQLLSVLDYYGSVRLK